MIANEICRGISEDVERMVERYMQKPNNWVISQFKDVKFELIGNLFKPIY